MSLLGGLTAVGLLAVGGAALLSRNTQKTILGDVEQDWLANELHFDCLHGDGVTVCLKGGEYLRVYSLRGLPYETRSLEEQANLAHQRADFLHQSVNDSVTIRFFGIKRQKDVSFKSEWPTPTLAEIGAHERHIYANAYGVHWYFVASSKDYGALFELSKSVQATFARYDVGEVAACNDDEDQAGKGCELTGVLNYLISGELRFDIPRISTNISANIPASDMAFDTNGTLTTQTPSTYHQKTIAIRKWPEVVDGRLISSVLAIPAEIEVCQVCKAVNAESAIGSLTRQIQGEKNNFFGNNVVRNQLEQANNALVNNEKSIYESQFQITVRARTTTELESIIDQIAIILKQSRVVFSVETVGQAVCWFNRIPEWSQLLRPLKIFDGNIAALWPFQFSPGGLYSSPFGNRPIRQFKTPTGQNYAFQFHVSDKPQSAGNYLVLAPTGTGKSTLIMHLLGGVAKFNKVRNYVFDSKDGARYMTEVMGGTYQGFEDLALNPLQVDLHTKQGLHRARMILRAMVGDVYTSDMDKEIQTVLTMAAQLDPEQRTFNNIYSAAFTPDSPLKAAFAKWVTQENGEDGQYSHIFNAPEDKIRAFLDRSFLTGINMNEALEDKILGPAVIAHISAAISDAAKQNRNGFTIFVDEAANLLRNKGFRDVVLEMYREYRKLNGLVGLAFQDPEALLKFDDAQGILKNTQTLLFMPNAQATTESLEQFNLTPDQIAFIRGQNRMSSGRHVLVVKRDLASGYDESAIIDVDLKDFGDALRFYRAGTDANADLRALQNKWGEEWLTKL